ncbi:ATP-binding protein [Desulfogranum mediterraneum]|uniref:ATP-binding protein n=1 Tax=Desulfogranum mediterraneum TaxID=160661 RepID=UPI00040AD46B|nr:ATP-binding protein [Desulfogranum mediterraneum]
MQRSSITVKLLSLVICAFVVTTVSVLFFADKQLTRIIDESQSALYVEKVEAILTNLGIRNERLRKTGLVEAYVEDFKQSAIKHLRQSYYKHTSQDIYPFIIDADGAIVMHPVLSRGELFLEQMHVVNTMLSAKEGAFESVYLGQEKWYYFKRFAPWGWVVGYAVPLEIKYADSLKFRNLLVSIMGGITIFVVLVLSFIIARFTKPITRLTNAVTAMAEGKPAQEVDQERRDEVGALARSFTRMQKSIQQTISDLEKEIAVRRTAEVALAQEKEQLSVTLRSIAEGVITTDISGDVVLLNKVAEELTGWGNDEAAGRPLKDVFQAIDEQSREVCENPAVKVIRSGNIVGAGERAVLVARDGRERSIANSGAPIRDANSNIIGVVLVFRDITEQLKTEKELLKIKKLESIGVLAGGIAHDFNNILTAILGSISLALVDEELKGKTKKLLSKSEKALFRAKDLTQQLLTFAKGGEPIRQISSLGNVIKDSADFVLRGSKVACSYHIPEDLWLVNVDKGQISQVIQNIVLNASNAMPDGGTVDISCENVQPLQGGDLLFPQKSQMVKVVITDSGTGISSDLVDKIFDPYFSTKAEGSGLGLAISHSIISKHNGQISVESTPGAGTAFTIFLPATSSQEKVRLVEESVKEFDHKAKAKVMVMDDEAMIRDVVGSMLASLGYEVVLADNGTEALELYREHGDSGEPIDVAIMDLTIPGGMGGQDAVKEVLAMDPEARVIVSSGYSTDPIMSNYQDYGFCAAVMKPFKLQEIAKVVNRVLAS